VNALREKIERGRDKVSEIDREEGRNRGREREIDRQKVVERAKREEEESGRQIE
jgi:hypothetical protein